MLYTWFMRAAFDRSPASDEPFFYGATIMWRTNLRKNIGICCAVAMSLLAGTLTADIVARIFE